MTTPDNELRERITAAYAPLVALYQLFEGRLREAPDDRPPVGWKPHLDALRALRDGKTEGDWADLTRLMVDPAALAPPQDPSAPGDPRVLLFRSTDDDAVLRPLITRLAEAHRRILLLAPTAEAAQDALRNAQGRFAVTVVPDADPPPGAVPETWVRGARLQPYGSAYQDSWTVESRRLQRDLLWLEQWPRDRAAVEAVRLDQERREAELAAAGTALAAELERLRDEAATAELAAAVARKSLDGLANELRRAEGSVAGLTEEYDRFRADADAATQTAAELTRVADEAYARHVAAEERYANSVQELDEARQREAFLLEELPRAKAALPEAEAAAAQAGEALTAAEADGHASYYRLAASESAMATEKQKMSLSQRLHIRAARPEAQDVKQQLSDRRREADESAQRAHQTRAALEQAEAYRTAVHEVITNGERELSAIRESQARLENDIVRFGEAREPARLEHQECARQAAEAVDHATDRESAARQAEVRLHQGQERLDQASTAHAEATAAVQQAETSATHSATAATETEVASTARRAEMATQQDQDAAELQAEIDTEKRSRRHVALLCGEDPTTVPAEVLTEHRDRAMARIEELTAYLDGNVPAEVLLLPADVVATTPAALSAYPAARDADYDTLVAVQAGSLTDGEFLIAAVHARHWILIGTETQTPPPIGRSYITHLHALAELAAQDASAAARPSGLDVTLDESASAPDATFEDRPTPTRRPSAPPTVEDRPSGRDVTLDDRLSDPDATFEDRPASDPDATLEDRPASDPDATLEDRPGSKMSPEAQRIHDLGLWESRYRDAYEKAKRRLEHLNGTQPPSDPAQILLTVLNQRLGHGLFERCATAAPRLLVPPPR